MCGSSPRRPPDQQLQGLSTHNPTSGTTTVCDGGRRQPSPALTAPPARLLTHLTRRASSLPEPSATATAATAGVCLSIVSLSPRHTASLFRVVRLALSPPVHYTPPSLISIAHRLSCVFCVSISIHTNLCVSISTHTALYKCLLSPSHTRPLACVSYLHPHLPVLVSQAPRNDSSSPTLSCLSHDCPERRNPVLPFSSIALSPSLLPVGKQADRSTGPTTTRRNTMIEWPV